MRACHLSGQIEADKAFAHYQANELPVTFEGAEPATDWETIVLTAAVLICVGVVLAIPYFVR